MTLISFLSDARRSSAAPRLDNERMLTLLGEIRADYTRAPLAPGDHTIRVVTLLGDVTIQFPASVGLEIVPVELFGGVTVKDMGSGAEKTCDGGCRTAGFESAAVRVRVHVTALFGDVELVRVPPTGRLTWPGVERRLRIHEGHDGHEG